MAVQFEFGILGGTIVRVGGREQKLRPRLRRILGALLANPRRTLPYHRVAEWVWSEEEALPKNLKSTFYTYGHRLRESLESCGVHARLSTGNGGLTLEVGDGLVDYSIFEQCFSEASAARRSGHHDEALGHVHDALSLWRGAPLADLDTELARGWRRAVTRNQFLPANELLIDEQIATGRYIEALRRLDALDRDFPCELSFAKRRLKIVRTVSGETESSDLYFQQRKTFREMGRDAEAEALREFYDKLSHETPAWPPEPVREVTAAETPKVQLPAEVTDFVGRADLLRELDRLTGAGSGVVSGSVVLLTGLGGIGKTTLAVRWARTAAERLGIGALFVDLRGTARTPRRDTADVVDLFLGRLGFSVEQIIGPIGRADKLASLLRERPRVIVLDNAEDSGHVRPLLRLFGSCPVVVTGRNRFAELAVQYGISSVEVDELSAAHALALLKQRIGSRAADPPDVLRELVDLAQGVPLALTLIGHRAASRSVPLSVIAEELREEGALLHVGHDGDGEDRSLAAVFSTTCSGLSAAARRLLVLLGAAPPAEFGVAAVAALLGESTTSTRRSLDELIGAHFVDQRGDDGRYRMHDLVFAYSESLSLADPESEQARRRLYSWYLHSMCHAHLVAFPHAELTERPSLAPGVIPVAPADEAAATRFYRQEHENLGVILHEAWRRQPDHAWPLVHATVHFLDRFGHYKDFVEWMGRAAVHADRNQHLEEAASTFNDLGYVQIVLGDTDAAAANLARAQQLAERLGSEIGELSVGINLASLERRKGNLAGALVTYQRCREVADRLHDRFRLARAEVGLAEVYREQGHLVVATEHLLRAIELWEGLSDVAREVAALADLCDLLRLRSRLDEAMEFAARALHLVEGLRGVAAELKLHTALAALYLALRRYDEAAEAAQYVVRLAHADRRPEAEAEALEVLGDVRYGIGEHEEAADAWSEAATIFEGRGHPGRAARLRDRIVETRGASLPGARAEESRPAPAADDQPR